MDTSKSNNIELKAAFKGCPEKLYDTLSSFSNQDDGGIILFGIDKLEPHTHFSNYYNK